MYQGAITFIFSFGIVIGLNFYENYKLKKLKRACKKGDLETVIKLYKNDRFLQGFNCLAKSWAMDYGFKQYHIYNYLNFYGN